MSIIGVTSGMQAVVEFSPARAPSQTHAPWARDAAHAHNLLNLDSFEAYISRHPPSPPPPLLPSPARGGADFISEYLGLTICSDLPACHNITRSARK